MTARQMPHTDSIKELADFWDTHDLTDFEDHLEEVSEVVFRRGSAVVVELPAQEVQAVQKMAQAQGVSEADLIHKWVTEKLHAT